MHCNTIVLVQLSDQEEDTEMKNGLGDLIVIAAVFGPDKALTIYSVVVWGSVVAFLLALGGCF